MTIKVENGRVSVQAEFHPDFPARAKQLGGRWNAPAKVWTFDERDAERVRSLCRDLYGTDGGGDVDLVTVTVRGEALKDGPAIFFCGREIASRRGRDASARLGTGVIVTAGELPPRGGSAKNPAVCPAGLVFEIRDVPRVLAERAVAAWRAAVQERAAEIVANPDQTWRTPLPGDGVSVVAELHAPEAPLTVAPLAPAAIASLGTALAFQMAAELATELHAGRDAAIEAIKQMGARGREELRHMLLNLLKAENGAAGKVQP